MPFIRTQKIVYDEQHRIVSGSASIVDVKYVPSQGKAHSKQTVRESLGAVVLLESKRKGIFLSKTRGLVEYDADMDAFTPVEADDARLTDSRITFTPSVHVVFGDVYGLLHFYTNLDFSQSFRPSSPTSFNTNDCLPTLFTACSRMAAESAVMISSRSQ